MQALPLRPSLSTSCSLAPLSLSLLFFSLPLFPPSIALFRCRSLHLVPPCCTGMCTIFHRENYPTVWPYRPSCSRSSPTSSTERCGAAPVRNTALDSEMPASTLEREFGAASVLARMSRTGLSARRPYPCRRARNRDESPSPARGRRSSPSTTTRPAPPRACRTLHPVRPAPGPPTPPTPRLGPAACSARPTAAAS